MCLVLNVSPWRRLVGKVGGGALTGTTSLYLHSIQGNVRPGYDFLLCLRSMWWIFDSDMYVNQEKCAAIKTFQYIWHCREENVLWLHSSWIEPLIFSLTALSKVGQNQERCKLKLPQQFFHLADSWMSHDRLWWDSIISCGTCAWSSATVQTYPVVSPWITLERTVCLLPYVQLNTWTPAAVSSSP